MNRLVFIVILLISTTPFTALYAKDKSSSIKPLWVNNAPKSSNPQQQYIVVEDLGKNISDLRANSTSTLNNYIKKAIKAKGAGESILRNAQINDYMRFLMSIDIDDYYQRKIDEYWEKTSTGYYRYYCLFAVSTNSRVMFEQVRVTDRYGANGLWRSMIVPGWGQFYKGSKLKGGLFLGGIVASAVGIIYTEAQRAEYANKATQTYNVDHILIYTNKSSNFETARNICIGGAAAIYIYNIIDAIVAPGARQVKITKNNGFTFNPIMSSEMNGLSVAYNF